MTTPPAEPSRMRDDTGLFSMVAVDQRESLRAMLAGSGVPPVTDERLKEFKVEVALALSPVASAMLVDTDYGLGPILEADALADGCDLIVALDVIDYDAQGVAQATSLRKDLVGGTWDKRVAGFKYLLLWTPGAWLGCDESDIQQFIEESARAGVHSVLEVIVREEDGSHPTPERQADMVVQAAKDMATLAPTLYKTEVPFRNLAPASAVTRVSGLITETINCPWVVLSGGVAGDQFPDAVRSTAQGGAEGFLAGRAVWSNATALVGAASKSYLENESVRTLAGLRSALRSGREARLDG